MPASRAGVRSWRKRPRAGQQASKAAAALLTSFLVFAAVGVFDRKAPTVARRAGPTIAFVVRPAFGPVDGVMQDAPRQRSTT